MGTAASKDGTVIAFDRLGEGPAVILVDGAFGHRAYWGQRPLAAELAGHFTVYTYDRRGRGESGDAVQENMVHYAIAREIEDLEALIAEAGGPVYLYGISSGAVLALRAAAVLGPGRVAKLALYEPPFNRDDEDDILEFARYTQRMAELLAAGQYGDAVALFLADMLPEDTIAAMRQSPEWQVMEAVAPTLAYDNAILGDGAVPVEAARAVTIPVLVLDGSESPDFLRETAEALARALPHAERKTLEGQTHAADPKIIAPVLVEFFNSRSPEEGGSR